MCRGAFRGRGGAGGHSPPPPLGRCLPPLEISVTIIIKECCTGLPPCYIRVPILPPVEQNPKCSRDVNSLLLHSPLSLSQGSPLLPWLE